MNIKVIFWDNYENIEVFSYDTDLYPPYEIDEIIDLTQYDSKDRMNFKSYRIIKISYHIVQLQNKNIEHRVNIYVI